MAAKTEKYTAATTEFLSSMSEDLQLVHAQQSMHVAKLLQVIASMDAKINTLAERVEQLEEMVTSGGSHDHAEVISEDTDTDTDTDTDVADDTDTDVQEVNEDADTDEDIEVDSDDEGVQFKELTPEELKKLPVGSIIVIDAEDEENNSILLPVYLRRVGIGAKSKLPVTVYVSQFGDDDEPLDEELKVAVADVKGLYLEPGNIDDL